MATDKTTIERLKEILIEEMIVGHADELRSEMRFAEDLGCDSLDVLEILMAIETEFDLEIPDEETDQIRTVGDAVKYIEDRATHPA
jgi:acyl carrier protein